MVARAHPQEPEKISAELMELAEKAALQRRIDKANGKPKKDMGEYFDQVLIGAKLEVTHERKRAMGLYLNVRAQKVLESMRANGLLEHRRVTSAQNPKKPRRFCELLFPDITRMI